MRAITPTLRLEPVAGRVSAAIALLIVAIAAVVAVFANVDAAAADSRACTPEGRGCASFKRAGNTFDVCDEAFDGSPVAVVRGKKIIAVNYWGSLKFNGCRRWHVEGRNGTPFAWKVCLARNARPGGKRITIERFFCSAPTPDIF